MTPIEQQLAMRIGLLEVEKAHALARLAQANAVIEQQAKELEALKPKEAAPVRQPLFPRPTAPLQS